MSLGTCAEGCEFRSAKTLFRHQLKQVQCQNFDKGLYSEFIYCELKSRQSYQMFFIAGFWWCSCLVLFDWSNMLGAVRNSTEIAG